ncbi:4Fe-4S binding protein [Bacilliculturomica massiliensis]|uniref:4Fe-4S binding protein n=1 Tax=Bacilliculturomica massiliensis TaxID=1917867 RepID=UPI001031552F|nr:4Fe-4S binding protein [Bacilliculturomica massiliensis]
MTVTVLKERCKGCNYCLKVCPKEAISPAQSLNNQGYECVTVDEERCISCGMCYIMCPESVFEIS